MGKRALTDDQADRAIKLAIAELGFDRFQQGLCATAALAIVDVLFDGRADLLEATSLEASRHGRRCGHVALRRKSTLFDYRGRITFDQIYEFVEDYVLGFRIEVPISPDLVQNLWCVHPGHRQEWKAIAYATMFVARAVVRGKLDASHSKFRGAQVLIARASARKFTPDEGSAPDLDGAAAWLEKMLKPYYLKLDS